MANNTKVRPHQIVDGEIEWINVHITGLAAQAYFLVWEFEYAGTVVEATAYGNHATAATYTLGISAGGVHGVGAITDITGLDGPESADNANTGNDPQLSTANEDFAVGSRLVLTINSVGAGPVTDFVIQIKLLRDP